MRVKVLGADKGPSGASKGARGGSKLGSLVLIPAHVTQVTRLVGQCEGVSRGASVWIKVRPVQIEFCTAISL